MRIIRRGCQSQRAEQVRSDVRDVHRPPPLGRAEPQHERYPRATSEQPVAVRADALMLDVIVRNPDAGFKPSVPRLTRSESYDSS
eukprot:COSAG06_NODE_30279_length_541_cov_1.529412_2_plen_85_part_00